MFEFKLLKATLAVASGAFVELRMPKGIPVPNITFETREERQRRVRKKQLAEWDLSYESRGLHYWSKYDNKSNSFKTRFM